MSDVVMPRLSDSMEEGTILRWLKRDGEAVRRGEPLVEIETDKANMTYDADQDGVLEVVAQEGDTLAIGEVIARFRAQEASGDGGAGAAVSAPTSAPTPPTPTTVSGPRTSPSSVVAFGGAVAPSPPASPALTPGPAAAPEERIKASPVARRLARERGIELRGLVGTGPGGRIVRADVEAARPAADGRGAPAETRAAGPPAGPALPAPPKAPAIPAPAPRGLPDLETAKGEVTVVEPTRSQQVIARRMAESKATVPHFTLEVDIDMEKCLGLRERLRGLAGDGPVPTYNDMVVKACALALREFPRANAAYRDGRFELYSRINVGVAVATQDSLVVPSVFDADIKSLGEIARETRALAERVRSGEITPPELSGGTFTVSNLGMFGVTRFAAVINPPQAAILAVGEIAEQPRVRKGEVVARHAMNATLACDHRILYGADAARFLARIRELLEQPLGLSL